MPQGYLTTHVLDTARGCPAKGIRIALYRVSGNAHKKVAESETNADGRTDAPILPVEKFKPGTYELIFFCGDYLRDNDLAGEDPLFLDQIPIRFGMADEDAHYHVPLLLSPYGYSTYRGS
ncbi:MAG: hydroxyisourate hydrolase [Pelagimonas sp.]|jgi:5-hydroxyisourate hydrolase|nr:hydroxyisourate hydrolase [Pelagimonas sp.]